MRSRHSGHLPRFHIPSVLKACRRHAEQNMCEHVVLHGSNGGSSKQMAQLSSLLVALSCEACSPPPLAPPEERGIP